MRLFEIDLNKFIDLDVVESVESNDFGCTIYTHHRKYNSIFPCSTMVELIKSINTEEPNTESKLNTVLDSVEHFAG